jgi:hypothetical protein
MQGNVWHSTNFVLSNILPCICPFQSFTVYEPWYQKYDIKGILNFQMAGRAHHGQNERIPPPPPPPPTMQELMAQQNEILRQLA